MQRVASFVRMELRLRNLNPIAENWGRSFKSGLLGVYLIWGFMGSGKRELELQVWNFQLQISTSR